MTRKGNLTTILLIVILAISLALGGGVFYFYQKERDRNLSLQDEMDSIKTRQRIAEKKLEESQDTISTLEIKLNEAKSQIGNLGAELQQEKAGKQEAQAKLEQLKIDLDQQKRLRAELEVKFNQAQKGVEKIQAQVRQLETRRVELETKITELEAQSQAQGVQLGRIIVAPENKAAAAVIPELTLTKPVPAKTQIPVPGIEGKVLVLNKDYDFVVISLGSKDGVNIGDTFSVYHGNRYAGDLKIEKVHDSMAAAGFTSADIKGKIGEGDKVVQKNK